MKLSIQLSKTISLSLLLLLLLIVTSPLMAQLERSAFTATGRGGVATTMTFDYQSLGVNPANLAVVKSFRDPLFTFGLGESSVSLSAEAISRADLIDAIREAASGEKTGGGQGLSYQDKIIASQRLAGTDLTANMDVMPIGFSIHLPGHQGFAFSVRSRMQYYSNFTEKVTDLLFTGANSAYFDLLALSNGRIIPNPRSPVNADLGLPPLTEGESAQVVAGLKSEGDPGERMSEFMAGSRVTVSLSSEINFGYGKRLYDSYNLSIYGGIDVSLIRGIVLMNLDVGADQTVNHNVIALPQSAIIEGSQLLEFNPNVKLSELLFPNDVSKGTAYTLGFTAVIKRNFRVGASVANWRGLFKNQNFFKTVGAVALPENAYSIADTEGSELTQFSGQGFDSYNILATDASSFQLSSSDSSAVAYQWSKVTLPAQELPANIRVGLSYDFVKTVHLGADIIIPLNSAFGNPSGPFVAIGGDFRVSRLLRISSGVNATFRTEKQLTQNTVSRLNMPLGITYTARKGTYEAGIATKDVFTYLFKGDGSTISFASGFLRFMIGKVPKK